MPIEQSKNDTQFDLRLSRTFIETPWSGLSEKPAARRLRSLWQGGNRTGFSTGERSHVDVERYHSD
jgi:hypothetical protein